MSAIVPGEEVREAEVEAVESEETGETVLSRLVIPGEITTLVILSVITACNGPITLPRTALSPEHLEKRKTMVMIETTEITPGADTRVIEGITPGGGYQGYRGNHAGGGFQIVGASRHARGGNSQGAYKVNPNQRVMGNKRYIDKGYTSISTRGRNVSSGSNDRSSGSNYDEYSGSYDGSGSYSGGGHGFRESIWVVKEKLFGSSELLADPSRMIIIDSGATNHYFKDADLFTTYHQLVGDEHIVEAANGGLMRKAGIGSVVVSLWNGNGFNRVQINNVFHLPGATANLLSVSQLEKIPGTNFEISGGLWQIRNGCYVDAIGVRVGGLYQIPILASEELSIKLQLL